MRIQSSGNVGIGTTNPGTKLDVIGTKNTGTGNYKDRGVLTVRDDTALAAGTGGTIVFQAKAETGGTYAHQAMIEAQRNNANNWEYASSLLFYTRPETGDIAERMRITSTGNVGIGTTSPGAPLQVGNAAAQNILFNQDSATLTDFRWATDARVRISTNAYTTFGSTYAATYGDSGIRLGQSDTGYSYIVGGTNLLLNPVSGNVGIGTTGPANKLQVTDATAAQALFSGWDETTGAYHQSGQILLGDTVAYQGRLHYNSGGNLYLDNSYNNDAGNIYIRTKTAGTAVNAVSILGSGNVGIGTTSPGEKLNINGNLALENQGIMKLYELRTSGVNYSGFRASSTMASDVTWSLPAAEGTTGQSLLTNGSGSLYWGDSSSVSALDDLTDVDTAGVAYGGLIYYNGASWEDIATSSLNILTDGATGLDYNTGTGVISLTGGYSIPLTASTTEWATAYSWGNHASAGYITDGNTGWDNSYGLITLSSLSATSPIAYDNGTGVISVAPLYNIPLTASTTNWNAFYDAPSSRITDGDHLTWSGNILNVDDDWYNAISDISLDKGYMIIGGDNGLAQATSSLFMSSTGFVGIGTTTPASKLSVFSSVGNQLTIAYDATHYADFLVNSAGNLSITPNVAGAMTTIGSGADVALKIDNNGNVGIGTTSPNQKLSIYNNAADSAIEFSSASGANYKWTMGLDYTDGSFRIASSSALGTNDRFVINGNGNVGIGTTDPGAKLEVVGGIKTSFSPANATPSLYGDNSFIIGIDQNNNNAGGDYFSIINGAGDREMVRVQGNGNVGIGTTSPLARLSIQGDGTNPIFGLADGTGASKVTVLNNGNVGIGTTTPGQKLEVNGSIRITAGSGGGLIFSDGSSMTAAAATATGYTSTTDLNFAADSDANGSGVMTFATHGAERVRVDNTGNVGIGMTNPAQKLDVDGAVGLRYSGSDVVNLYPNTGATEMAASLSGVYATGKLRTALDIRPPSQSWGAANAVTELTVYGYGDGSGDYARLNFGKNSFPTTSVSDPFNISIETGGSYAMRPLTIGLQDHTTGWNRQTITISPVDGSMILGEYAAKAPSESVIDYDPIDILVLHPPTLVATGMKDSHALVFSGNSYSGSAHRADWKMFTNVLDTSATSNLVFQTRTDSNAYATKMVISDGGNVGIGTTSPFTPLTVIANASSKLGLAMVENGSTKGLELGVNLGEGFIQAWDRTNSAAFPYYFAGTSISFLTGGVNPSTDRKMTITSTGNVGIGTTTPTSGLHIGSVAAGKKVMIANGALCVDNNDSCAGATAGTIYAVNGTVQGADYAEYFYSADTRLKPGEVVCVDVERDNAVERCDRGHDNNIMGIVSTNPSITGNNSPAVESDPAHYAVIGMLGQVDAFVSAENGPIRVGDSLTSASSTPGYAMRADAGDSTVGVALESLESGDGKIKVLISRRNKSLAVEQVEQLVTDRIAN
ncbi:MAG: hypothetical protein WC734_06450, partial [Patescibacteria group bacterium]